MGTSNDSLLISYKNLRRSIGILGILLPIIMIIGSAIGGGCDEVLNSISMYYHTTMRDFFVGILCAVALFLYTYRGYDIRDYMVSRAASIFALGIAFCPTDIDSNLNCINTAAEPTSLISTFHFISATLFFITLAYNSLFLFTLTDKSEMSDAKKKRNIIYKTCGYIMIACIILIAIYFLFIGSKFPQLTNYNPVFWLESLALWAFGFSWLTKGEMIFGDE
jgi:hypothetical protein